MDLKCIIAKCLKIILNPPALNNCIVDKTSKIGPRSELTNCTLGRYSYLGQQCFMVNVEIGSFCSIADRCSVGGASHPIHFVSTSPVFHEGKNVLKKNFSTHHISRTKKTVIGNDVWIGQGAFIKAGVTIGDGAVIGMGAVVLNDVLPYEIWAGVPAKRIRHRFNDDIIENLKQIEWWKWDESTLEKNAPLFDDLEVFIAEVLNK